MRIETGDRVTIKEGVPMRGYNGDVRVGVARNGSELWQRGARGVVLTIDDPERGEVKAGPFMAGEIEYVQAGS
jgi:hypothetical protein